MYHWYFEFILLQYVQKERYRDDILKIYPSTQYF